MSIQFNPYLNFNGNTREAMEFYKSVFGGKLEVTTFGDMKDMPSTPGYEDKIMHSVLTADDVIIMASEGRPDQPTVFGDNISLSFSGNDHDKLTGYFKALGDGGKVIMELAPMPWGDDFGALLDKFGVNWMVNISKA